MTKTFAVISAVPVAIGALGFLLHCGGSSDHTFAPLDDGGGGAPAQDASASPETAAPSGDAQLPADATADSPADAIAAPPADPVAPDARIAAATSTAQNHPLCQSSRARTSRLSSRSGSRRPSAGG